MTERQKRFCDEYLISGNASDAARKAGYSKRTAGRIGGENLQKLEIKQYLQERMEQMESEKIADAEEVLKYLTAVMRGEETDEVIDKDGQKHDVKVNNNTRVKSAELLAKRFGLLTEKVELGGSVVVIQDDVEDDPEDDVEE